VNDESIAASGPQDPFRGWIASLSNGETIFEAQSEPGERSAWQQLRNRCADEGLHLTQLRLQLNGVTLIGVSAAEGYCQAWQSEFEVFYKTHVQRRGLGSMQDGHLFMTWIDNSGNIKQDVFDMQTEEGQNMLAHCITKV
jgi:hypothetical protein